jgi:DNA excision repair protein ERCC-5
MVHQDQSCVETCRIQNNSLLLQDQVDSLLVPVVRSYEDRQTQTRMDAFVSMTHRFAKIRSKRLQKAVAGVAGIPLGDEMVLGHSDVVVKQGKASRKKSQTVDAERDGAEELRVSFGSRQSGFGHLGDAWAAAGPGRGRAGQRKRTLDISEHALRDTERSRAAERRDRRLQRRGSGDGIEEWEMEGERVDNGLSEFLH